VRTAEIKLKGMDRPTQQSFYGKTILDFLKTRVCSFVYSFAFCLRSELLLSQGGLLDLRYKIIDKLCTIAHKSPAKSAIHLSVKTAVHQAQEESV